MSLKMKSLKCYKILTGGGGNSYGSIKQEQLPLFVWCYAIRMTFSAATIRVISGLVSFLCHYSSLYLDV